MSAHPVERKYREPSNGAPTGGFDGDAFYDPIGADMAAAEAQPATAGWDGTEEWEALAWHLCAEENGEDACNELVWEGGPMPEPWGDRWLKYEGAAKDMIARVRKFAPQPAAQPLTDEQIAALVLATVYEGDSSTAHRDAWAAEIGVPFARAIERAHGIGEGA